MQTPTGLKTLTAGLLLGTVALAGAASAESFNIPGGNLKAALDKYAQQTGAALVYSDETPQALRRKVTSPGGTTEAAITHLSKNHWPQITVDAIKSAERRGKELGS